MFSESFLRRLEKLALIFRNAAKGQMSGERRSSRRGQSVEFSDFRPYTLGDDFRRIDWNAYARLERLFLKLFVEEEEITLHLLVDNSKSMDWGEPNKLEYAVRAAAAMGYIALVGLDRVSVSALYKQDGDSNLHFAPVRGKVSTLRLFSSLQGITPAPKPISSGSIITSTVPNIQSPGMVIVFSDLMGDQWQPAASQLRSLGHEISIIHILSPEEIAPELSGDFALLDSETDAEIRSEKGSKTISQIEITADYETLQRYKMNLIAWQDDWRKFCTARQIAYVPVSTSVPLEDLLFAWMPARGILR
jgi:uncharacterized protein (DUF58 family)